MLLRRELPLQMAISNFAVCNPLALTDISLRSVVKCAIDLQCSSRPVFDVHQPVQIPAMARIAAYEEAFPSVVGHAPRCCLGAGRRNAPAHRQRRRAYILFACAHRTRPGAPLVIMLHGRDDDGKGSLSAAMAGRPVANRNRLRRGRARLFHASRRPRAQPRKLYALEQ